MKDVLISASIGCDLNDEPRLYEILDAGARIIRVPFWREFEDDITRNLLRVRKYNPQIPFLIDTKSEKIRFGNFFENPQKLNRDLTYTISLGKTAQFETHLPVEYDHFFGLCKVGDEIVCGDGEAVFKILENNTDSLIVQPELSVILPSRKGLAVTGRNIISKNMSGIDYEIDYAIRNGIDWIAISFTESDDDINYVRDKVKAAGKKLPFVMGKIENQKGMDNLEAIIRASDGIMIARGDLPVHADYGKMGLYQKEILRLCNQYNKFAMVSTGVIMSATSKPRPFPAEITDITTAVLDGADSIQLCEETVYDSSNRANAVRMTKHIIDSCLDYLAQK